VYWHAFSSEAWKKKQAVFRVEENRLKALEPRVTDVFRPGEAQSERDHNVKGERSSVGELELRKHREATRGGWFSFEMKVDPKQLMDLVCTYWGDQANRTFDILVEGTKIAAQTLNRDKPGEFFAVTYPVPGNLTQGKGKITVRLELAPPQPGSRSAGAGPLFGAILLKRQ
jgi:hypothetical protein